MIKYLALILGTWLNFQEANGQDFATYLKGNAIRIDNPEQLSDAAFPLLAPFQVIMMGEMHGSNEPAQFVGGLVNLLTEKGDSVQLGLEIPPELMRAFLASHTEAGIYQSRFFTDYPYPDGRESYAWAGLIAQINNNPKAQIFFFDANKGEDQKIDRDSLMFLKIKKQYQQHPGWKMVTLSGNYHCRLAEGSMATYLKKDRELNLSAQICTLNHYYLEGSCRANFGHGLEEKTFSREESVFDTTLGFDKYLLLMEENSSYPYTGFYYTRNITAAKMTADK